MDLHGQWVCSSRNWLAAQRREAKKTGTKLSDTLLKNTSNQCCREGCNNSLQYLTCVLPPFERKTLVQWEFSCSSQHSCQDLHRVHATGTAVSEWVPRGSLYCAQGGKDERVRIGGEEQQSRWRWSQTLEKCIDPQPNPPGKRSKTTSNPKEHQDTIWEELKESVDHKKPQEWRSLNW